MVQVPKLRPRKAIKPMMTVEMLVLGFISTAIMALLISSVWSAVSALL